jgi:hypothetical protein
MDAELRADLKRFAWFLLSLAVVAAVYWWL